MCVFFWFCFIKCDHNQVYLSHFKATLHLYFLCIGFLRQFCVSTVRRMVRHSPAIKHDNTVLWPCSCASYMILWKVKWLWRNWNEFVQKVYETRLSSLIKETERKKTNHIYEQWAMSIEQWASYQLKHDDTIRRLNCLWKKSKNRLK